jgi:hypothetical protein
MDLIFKNTVIDYQRMLKIKEHLHLNKVSYTSFIFDKYILLKINLDKTHLFESVNK